MTFVLFFALPATGQLVGFSVSSSATQTEAAGEADLDTARAYMRMRHCRGYLNCTIRIPREVTK